MSLKHNSILYEFAASAQIHSPKTLIARFVFDSSLDWKSEKELLPIKYSEEKMTNPKMHLNFPGYCDSVPDGRMSLCVCFLIRPFNVFQLHMSYSERIFSKYYQSITASKISHSRRTILLFK